MRAKIIMRGINRSEVITACQLRNASTTLGRDRETKTEICEMGRYRYAGYSSKGRHHGQRLNLHEIMHLIISLQMLFGSRRGGTGLLLLIIVVGVIAYLIYSLVADPTKALAKADILWDRDDRVAAVRQYKQLLRKRDPLSQDGLAWLQDSRPRLYRRIITFEAEYGDPADARDWIKDAWNEGHRDLVFDKKSAQDLWSEETQRLQTQDRPQNPLDELIPDF